MNVVHCLRLWSSSSVPLWSLCSLCVQWSLPNCNRFTTLTTHCIYYRMFLSKPCTNDQTAFLACSTVANVLCVWHSAPLSSFSVLRSDLGEPGRLRLSCTSIFVWRIDDRLKLLPVSFFLLLTSSVCSDACFKPGCGNVLKRLVWMCVKLLTEPLDEMWMSSRPLQRLWKLWRTLGSLKTPYSYDYVNMKRKFFVADWFPFCRGTCNYENKIFQIVTLLNDDEVVWCYGSSFLQTLFRLDLFLSRRWSDFIIIILSELTPTSGIITAAIKYYGWASAPLSASVQPTKVSVSVLWMGRKCFVLIHTWEKLAWNVFFDKVYCNIC